MSLTIVVGGQFGGEGKGSVSAFVARADGATAVVKTGGPNCSHTIVAPGGDVHHLRMLPTAAVVGTPLVLYPAGCLIHVDTLFREIGAVGFGGKIIVDTNAGIITDDLIRQQRDDRFYGFGGSTLTGTGYATAQRAQRRLALAAAEPRLKPYLGNVVDELVTMLSRDEPVLVEGSQAYGLSNYHGDYPFVTSRDTTTAAFMSQVGLGHRWIGDVIMVVKAFPTRNAHGEGHLVNELPSAFVDLHSALHEYGGGTYEGHDIRRRVGLFAFHDLARAVAANSPSYLALTGLDRLEQCLSEPMIQQHYGSIEKFCGAIAAAARVPIGLKSYGADLESIVDCRAPAEIAT